MCLDYTDEKTEKFEHGWKVFQKKNKNLYGLYYNINYKYPVNKWIQDTKPGEIFTRYLDYDNVYKTNRFSKYEKGFHFYKTRREARMNCRFQNATITFSNEKYVVRKIKVEKVVASGTDCGYKTGVAKWMKILRDKT